MTPGSGHVTTLTGELAWLGETLIETGARLGRSTLTTPPGPSAPPIAFHLWHAARWSDRLAGAIPRLSGETTEEADQIWSREDWAGRWGFSGDLGRGDSGWGLGDDLVGALPWPATDDLLAYVRVATEACQRAVGSLADDELGRSCIDLYDEESTIGEVVVGHISHVARHLGMIEGIVGALGGRGTATV